MECWHHIITNNHLKLQNNQMKMLIVDPFTTQLNQTTLEHEAL